MDEEWIFQLKWVLVCRFLCKIGQSRWFSHKNEQDPFFTVLSTDTAHWFQQTTSIDNEPTFVQTTLSIESELSQLN